MSIFFHSKSNDKHSLHGDAISFPEFSTVERDLLSNVEEDTILNHEGILERYNGTSFEVLNPVRIANSAGTEQFLVDSKTPIRFEGAGDTSIAFDAATNKITITSVPSSGTASGLTSFNGRTAAAAVPVSGDYNTSMVPENTNLYFTNTRVRTTNLLGLTIGTNAAIVTSDTLIIAAGKLQTQINNRVPNTRQIISGNWLSGGGNLTENRTLNVSPTVDNWLEDNQGNRRMFFGSESLSGDGIVLRHSGINKNFSIRREDDVAIFRLSITGTMVLGSVPWARLTEHISIVAGTGLSGGGALASNRTLNVVYGTNSGTSTEGNDSRVLNGQTAYTWGNHALAGYAIFGTGGSQVRTNTQLDARFVRKTGDSMTGDLFTNSRIASTADGHNLIFLNGNETYVGSNSRLNATIASQNTPRYRSTTDYFDLWHQGNLNPNNYVLKSGDTMSGLLTIEKGLESLRIKSLSSGASATGWVTFTDFNDIRQGYIGLGSAVNSDMYLRSDVGSLILTSSPSHSISLRVGATERANVSVNGLKSDSFFSEEITISMAHNTNYNIKVFGVSDRAVAFLSAISETEDIFALYRLIKRSNFLTLSALNTGNFTLGDSTNTTIVARQTSGVTATVKIRITYLDRNF